MTKRLTTEQFIEEARAVHGDRYDYSLVDYVNTATKVTINCSEHGPFDQAAGKHLRMNGCPQCGFNATAGKRRHTRLKFIEKAIAVHGERYDYSLVDYVNTATKVQIRCPTHGIFTQRPNRHLVGQGCPDCGWNKHSTDYFIAKAKAIHGDKYDYSKVEYVNKRKKVTIVCPMHGPFLQLAGSHLSGLGCAACGGHKAMTPDEFLDKAREVHGDRYDYSKTKYKNSKSRLTIVCPEHGPFRQRAESHLLGRGCLICSGNLVTTESFIQSAKEVHGNRYDYSKVKYSSTIESVTIVCRKHGAFEQVPRTHLAGSGCVICSGRRHSTQSFVEKAIGVHGKRYDYSLVDYVQKDIPVTIICKVHGRFEQRPGDHVNRGRMCPACSEYGFNPLDRAVLYYLAVKTDDDYTRYKIGITNRSVEERYCAADLARIRVVTTWNFFSGYEAKKRETEILRNYTGDKYLGEEILISGGNTELFTHDILGLDNDE